MLSSRRRPDLIVAAVSLALAVLVTCGLWLDPAGRAITVNSGDQALFEWLLAYGAHALTHGENPLFTYLVNVPDGVNLAVNTSISVYAFVFAPLTMLAGPPVTFAVILTLNLAATAYAWYWFLARVAGLPALAAGVAGVFCGFAPQMVSHANAHLNWTAQWLVPLLLWRVFALRQREHPIRNGVVLGILVAVAFSIAAEALFFTALACGVFLCARQLSAAHRAAARADLAPFARGLALAAGTAFVLLAYPLWLHFFGAQGFHGTGFDHRIHAEDVAAYGAFPARSLAGVSGLDTTLAPNPTEENSFFGLPLLLLAVACTTLLWRRSDAASKATLRALLITGAVFALLSFGPRVKWLGEITEISLPYAVLGKLPVFNAALPARLALVVTPVVGLLLGWALAVLTGRAGAAADAETSRADAGVSTAGGDRAGETDTGAAWKLGATASGEAGLAGKAGAGALEAGAGASRPGTQALEPGSGAFRPRAQALEPGGSGAGGTGSRARLTASWAAATAGRVAATTWAAARAASAAGAASGDRSGAASDDTKGANDGTVRAGRAGRAGTAGTAAGGGTAASDAAGGGTAGGKVAGPVRWRVWWAVAFAVALLPLVPVPLLTDAREPVPDFITSGRWRDYVSEGGVLVPVPPTSDLLPDGQRWQAYALAAGQGRFAIPAGFFLGPGGPDGRGRIGPVPRPTADLITLAAKTGEMPEITDADRAAAQTDLRYWRAQVVVLPDRVHGAKWPVHVDTVLSVTTALLGPPRRVDDVWLWTMRD